MKSYTPPVVGEKPERKGLISRVLGKTHDVYYEGRHKEESVYALWIEACMFGRVRCFPCVLDEAGDFLVYEPVKTPETVQDNQLLIQRWPLFLNQETAGDYHIRKLEYNEFSTGYQKYRKRKLDLEFAKLERPDGAETLPEAQSAPLPEETSPGTEVGEAPQKEAN